MDMMIDIETLSTHPDAAVISIGAVASDDERVLEDACYLCLRPSQVVGHIDPETVAWWLRQPNAAEAMTGDMAHASACPFDALQYAPGPWLALVECDGEIVEHGDPPDKFCARRRRILRRIDATAMLRQFARECALSVLHLWDAPAVVKQYLETGDEKLRYAARDAADAAYAAASASHRKRFREMAKGKFPEWEDVA